MPLSGRYSCGLVIALWVFGASGAHAQTAGACAPDSAPAEIVAIDGDVLVTPKEGAARPARLGDFLCAGDRVTTGDASAVDLRFAQKNSVTNVFSSSTVVIQPGEEDVSLVGGLLRFISSVRGSFKIATPHTDAGIDGTEATIAVLGPGEDTLILVREGVVTASDRRGSDQLSLAAGEAAYVAQNVPLAPADPNTVPEPLRGYLINPDSAADWAVYYPPILIASGSEAPDVLRAAALLDAGEPEKADALLRDDDSAPALALRSIAATFRNQTDGALTLANAAVAADPSFAASHIAHSYALQASGEIDQARRAIKSATDANADDAYAWARRAELDLTAGHRRSARKHAARSLELAETGLGRAVEGYAALASGDRTAAEAAFARSIEIDSENPLPHLGRGLLLIEQGDLETGRLSIETAAALDPRRSSLRSWLGRAYLDENLAEKAGAQFALAIDEDPEDPTPHLFAADLYFSTNQPIVALGAIAEADALSGGRDTLRTREGLGEDTATRESLIGRVYDVLGFEQQAIEAGARAVAADPTNPGAHRFLADVYRTRPGFEIAQTSERLVSQLLSGPSLAPVQPQLGEADLALFDGLGASRITFHEFNPAFDSDGVRLDVAGLVGTQNTLGNELSFTAKEGDFSVGFGQFHFQTDGVRQNNDQRQELAGLQIKGRVSDALTIFSEAEFRHTDQGGVVNDFRNQFSPTERVVEDRVSARLGLHAELAPGHDVLLVGTVASFDRELTANDPGQIIDDTIESDGIDLQGRYIGKFGDFTAQFGGAALYLDTDQVQDVSVDVFVPQIFPGVCLDPSLVALDNGSCGVVQTTVNEQFDRYYSAYGYGTWQPFDALSVTLGASVDMFDNEFVSRTQANPKAAVVFQPLEWARVRAAVSRSLKRPFVLDQILEPTTLGGFNQFFDDRDGTDAWLYGAGVDIHPLDNLWLGLEAVYRELESPVAANGGGSEDIATDEVRLRAYANMALTDRIALAIGAERTDFSSDDPNRLTDVETTLVPVTLSYFDPSGFFGSLGATYVTQDVSNDPGLSDDPFFGRDQGVLVDAAIGYRLPNRRGVVSLEVLNIFDTNLNFQDELTFSNRPLGPTIARELTVLGQLSLSF